MKKKDSFWDDPNVRDLYLACLLEIPLAKNVPRGKPKTPPEEFRPANFDELYAARADLQAGTMVLYRESQLQQWYLKMNELASAHQKRDPQGYHVFKTPLEEDLRRRRIIIQPNDYPYPVPDDTAHNVFWYAKGVSRYERAKYLAKVLFLEELNPGDFFLFRNPPHGKSIPEIQHDHLYTRIVSRGPGLLRPCFLPVEVEMAMAGEPGYTLERAFKHVNSRNKV